MENSSSVHAEPGRFISAIFTISSTCDVGCGFVTCPPSFFSRWFCLVGGFDHFEMANAGLHDLSIIVGTCVEGFVAEMRTLNVWTTVRWSGKEDSCLTLVPHLCD